VTDDDRFGGEHGHLYDGFAKCSRCRFFAKDPAVVAQHELGCTGRTKAIYWDSTKRFFCMGCRFDGETREELLGHWERRECVNEIAAITMPIYQLNYDVLDRRQR
jgi:hypothetical protein